MIQNTKQKKHTQRQSKVDQRLHILGKQKQVLGDVDLSEDPSVTHERGHALAGRLVKAGKNQIPTKQIGRIMRCGSSKKLGKHQLHHQERKEWRQDAPHHAQRSALIFFLEIPFHQLLKQELVALQCS